ncbi:hypothetical protein JoomaDRAFT_3937 [Galbibacter orientalis DSM 19592]|uniref:Uncharacterized protein n=1 Tax=Galbibacter orientalis DSM 19592 TaxID=926559 RepID=I3CB69_9FLAO|nr:hypothetical protein [Galbibacter orientalis]EIJ40862.1 hypothetical protein JoomaDRAFT_3937 [Galbibacter orientalis DSM 19592]
MAIYCSYTSVANNMNKLILHLLMIIGLSSCGQDLKCSDFKNGKFLIPGDSIYPISSIIIRKDGRQVEWEKVGDSTHAIIKYLDDCNWILTYDTELNELDELEQLINDSGGVKVEVLEIKGDTLFYNGIFKNDTLLFEQPGTIIKLK